MKQKKLILFAAVLLLISAAAIWIWSSYRVPVLMYHSINSGAEKSRLIVSPQTFEKQMRFLRDHRYRIMTMEEYVDILRNKKPQPRHSVVITFDDGYADNYSNAFPVLKKYSVPATIFVIPGWVNENKPDIMTWDQIRALVKSGLVEIGSHSYSHCVLTGLEENRILAELRESKMMLEEKLGINIRYFSYPCGFFSNRIKKETADQGYAAACATHPGSEVALDDIYAIRRIRISNSADNLFVFGAQVSGYYTFLKDRRVKYKNLDR